MRPTDAVTSGNCRMRVSEIDRLIRSGHLDVAVPQITAHINCTRSGAWRDVVRQLRGDGLVPEANLLEIVSDQPEVLRVIPRLRLLAIIVAIVPFVLFLTQMGMLALIPAISIGVFAFESQRSRVLRHATPSLMPAQRAVISDFLDLSTYVAGDLHLTRWVTIGCSTLAMLFVAGGITLGVTESDSKATMVGAALALSGLAMLAATLLARAHVRDLEFRRPFPSFRRPVRRRRPSRGPTTTVDLTAYRGDPRRTGIPVARARLDMTQPLTPAPGVRPAGPGIGVHDGVRIPFPTPGRTLLQLTVLLAACAFVAWALPATPVIVGCSAVATLAILRAAHTSVSVDNEQIRTVSIVATRTIPLSTVQSARTPATATGGGGWQAPRLELVFLDERTRTIAVAGVASRPSHNFQWPPGSRAARIVAAAERINAARG